MRSVRMTWGNLTYWHPHLLILISVAAHHSVLLDPKQPHYSSPQSSSPGSTWQLRLISSEWPFVYDPMATELLTTPVSEELCKQDITSKFPQTEKNQSTNPKARMVLLGSKSRCSGAKFGFISGQLYCSSEVVKTPGRGMFLLQSQMLPPWELIEVFQSCRRSTFSALVLVWDPGLIWRTELGPIRLGGYDWGRWKRQDGSSLL